MRHAATILLACLVWMSAATEVVAAKPKPKGLPDLSGWARSRDELIARFLEALQQNDNAELERLKVSEEEYVGFILPGSVAPGQPLRKWPREVSGYFYRDLNTKSMYAQQALLHDFGGRGLKLESVEYEEGTKKYANHVAYRQLRLKLKEPDGSESRLATGSIAEVKGRYKFVSFVAD
jgi:hypothetical protein